MSNIIKLHAAYKAGFLGTNILETYFSFIANMILEDHTTIVEEFEIATRFQTRYSIDLPVTFVRQVLGVGVQKGCFVENRGKYSVVIQELEKYRFCETEFDSLWDRLTSEFSAYCLQKDISLPAQSVCDFILSILDDSDERILSGEKVEKQEGMSSIEYAWYSFAREQGEKKTELFSFIAALSASNITKQALFYFGDTSPDYSDLHVYLDSPIVFALLGMDTEARTESYKTLVADMLKAKCNVHVLDHNFQEVDGILAKAATWATSTQYDLRYANNATRYFHDLMMSQEEIAEFCGNVELKLNSLGITLKNTEYDILQDKFQEDEAVLFDMIKTRYQEKGMELTYEKEASIRVDVRSIIVLYRERQGQTATRLQNAKHIMLTSNNTIANVSRNYESNKSLQSGHIPACISADLFGAILWLDSPMQGMEYQKEKLLADCYAFLKPDKKLLDKYICSLDDARNADEIDEKKYLFLRTHKVVLDSLMNVTQGDYARFNSQTYLEVYDDIQSKALKQYRDEASAHKQTRKEKEELENSYAQDMRKNQEKIESLEQKISSLETQEQKRKEHMIEKKTKWLGRLFTAVLIGLPYFVLVVAIEVLKTQFSDVSWKSVYGISGTVVATAIAGFIFAKGKEWCFKKARSIAEKSNNLR